MDEAGAPTDTYLEYISLMYDLEAAKLVQYLEVLPKGVPLRKLAKKLDMDKKELKEKLEPLVEKGFLILVGNHYSIPNPLMIYDAPFILKVNYEGNDAKKFAELSRRFFEKEEYYKPWETSIKGNPRSRVLTVSEKIEPGHDIIPVEEVFSILEKHTSFALTPCPCRKRAEVEGIRKCVDKYPILNCIQLGNFAEAILSMGDPVNRRITREEAIENVKKASELGLVLTTDNYVESAILCSCCECCCGLLAGLTRTGLNNPKSIAKANYIATINENCVACGTCLDRCKFGAITVEGKASVDEERCMGCGLCAVTCPNDAISLSRLERSPIKGTSLFSN